MIATIKFHLGQNPEEKLRFAFSPLGEMSLALEALVNPKRHPLQLRWVLAVKPSLSVDLWREIRALAFAYKTWQLGLFSPTAEDAIPSFDEEWKRIESMDLEQFVAEAARAFVPVDGEDPSGRQVLEDPAIQSALVEHATHLDPAYADAARLLISDAGALRDRLLRMLRRFWEECFAQEWARIGPALADDVAVQGERLRQHDIYTVFRKLLPGCRTVRGERSILFNRHMEGEVDLDQHPHLLLVPSFFTWARTRVEFEPPWTPSLVYPAGHADTVLAPLPPAELGTVLEALAHDTRLQILRLCREAPRSTQELANLLGLTAGGVSRHLSLLHEAGLVAPRRRSYYVLYRTVTKRLRAVSPALQQYVERA